MYNVIELSTDTGRELVLKTGLSKDDAKKEIDRIEHSLLRYQGWHTKQGVLYHPRFGAKQLFVQEAEQKRITIKIVDDEYQVPYTPEDPSTDDGIYYTDDKDDAIGTAKMIYARFDLRITFKRID